jgi:hypothetical protein
MHVCMYMCVCMYVCNVTVTVTVTVTVYLFVKARGFDAHNILRENPPHASKRCDPDIIL